jgi:(E)-4-hydroxy-3-methylbut-2-enyl-diphosphate synthase
MPTRDDAWKLLCEYTQSESLRKHMLAVEACVRAYARKSGADENTWGLAALLHDFDYERWPNQEHSPDQGHPSEGAKILREKGYSEEIIRAILSHADYCNVPRQSALEHTLFACDEIAGFLTACAYVRPSKSILDLEVDSVKRRTKSSASRSKSTSLSASPPCAGTRTPSAFAAISAARLRPGPNQAKIKEMLTQIAGFDAAATRHPRRKTHGVKVGHVCVGGGAPIVVQSMTNTDTADIESTFKQTVELAEAGSEIVRWTVNVPEAAAAVPEIKKRLLDAGCRAPIIGDFHYNGHVLLTKYPECARQLDKYRINPGNVGAGQRRDEQFTTICKVAVDNGKPVRIGVNGGSLNQELVMRKMQENTDKSLGKASEEIINECMVISALESTELALESGLRHDQIIISCKTSRPRDLITVYRDLSAKTEQPLHLGLTEAGMGMKGQIWSAASLGVLLYEGIGDTIRISLTPRPGGDRREEVYAACELLQALGLRSFAPSVTACPGCGRTTSTTFQELAEAIQGYIRDNMPVWKMQYEGVESMTLAVMGCIVNGPGESKAANIGISLPGTGEAPRCPVYIDGKKEVTLEGTYDELAAAFQALVDNYIAKKYPRKAAEVSAR